MRARFSATAKSLPTVWSLPSPPTICPISFCPTDCVTVFGPPRRRAWSTWLPTPMRARSWISTIFSQPKAIVGSMSTDSPSSAIFFTLGNSRGDGKAAALPPTLCIQALYQRASATKAAACFLLLCAQPRPSPFRRKKARRPSFILRLQMTRPKPTVFITTSAGRRRPAKKRRTTSLQGVSGRQAKNWPGFPTEGLGLFVLFRRLLRRFHLPQHLPQHTQPDLG